jgi:hypothetical protein
MRWRRMEISWTYHLRYEEVLQTDKEEKNILPTAKGGRLTGFSTSCIETAFCNTLLKEKWREG